MSNSLAFTYCSARSGAITAAFGAVVVIESVAVHFAVAAHHLRVALKLDHPDGFLRAAEARRAASPARTA
jgi:hypothetical protein